MRRTRVVRGLRALRRPPRRAVVSVGVFDGLHLAHQQLVRATVHLARRLRGTSVAVTFDPDPQRVLHPAKAQPALMPLAARLERLGSLGIDRVWIIPFTRSFARLTAESFIRRLVIGRLRARAVIVGEAFAFGRGRRGDMTLLRRVGARCGLRVQALRAVRRGGAPISSSRIRRLVAAGALAGAQRLLGRAPEVYGTVVRGAGRGRRLGVRTANLRLTSHVLPPQGVYAVAVHRDGGRRVLPGVMNLGVRPTFGPGPVVCEVHLLDFSGSLLGEPVRVSLLSRLRGERCFPSWEALRRQIDRDIARARVIYARSARLVHSS